MAVVFAPSSNGSQFNHWLSCRSFFVWSKVNYIQCWSMSDHFKRLETSWFTPGTSLEANYLTPMVSLTILNTPRNNSSLRQSGVNFYTVLSGMDLVNSAFVRSDTYTLCISKSQILGNMASMFFRDYNYFHQRYSLFSLFCLHVIVNPHHQGIAYSSQSCAVWLDFYIEVLDISLVCMIFVLIFSGMYRRDISCNQMAVHRDTTQRRLDRLFCLFLRSILSRKVVASFRSISRLFLR